MSESQEILLKAMEDHQWRTAKEIAEDTGIRLTAISAKIVRLENWYVFEKRRKNGYRYIEFEYKLVGRRF